MNVMYAMYPMPKQVYAASVHASGRSDTAGARAGALAAWVGRRRSAGALSGMHASAAKPNASHAPRHPCVSSGGSSAADSSIPIPAPP